MDAFEVQDNFKNVFSLKVEIYNRDKTDEWNRVLEQVSYIPIEYTCASLEYQHEYMWCFVEDLIDISVILYHNGKPIGLWPLSLRKQAGQYAFATNEGPVLPPIYIQGISEKVIRKYDEACLDAMHSFYMLSGKAINISPMWEGKQTFLPTANRPQSMIWYRKCMEKSATANVCNDLYVNLSLNEASIHQKMRKSFRSLVHEGERLWDVKIHSQVTRELFREYRLMHARVAGRVTRSIDSWNLQEKAINEKDAFLVTARDENNELIGGGFFSISRDEGSYGVGVYNRDLFDKPVSHVIQWNAIKYMKGLGLKWHKIGRRFYKGDTAVPSEKELNIAYFKEGFATDMFFTIVVDNKIIC